MQNVSAAFLAASKSLPYIARLTLDDVDIIQGDAIKGVRLVGGSNGQSDVVTLGSTVSGSAEILLDKSKVLCSLEGRKLFLEFGIQLGTEIEWLPMGTYTVKDPVVNDDILTITANDDLAAKFDVKYEPLADFDFGAKGGYDAKAFLKALCARRGVEINIDDLEPIQLNMVPLGYTERQIIGFISALYGGFANIDRLGRLTIRRYAKADFTADPDSCYDSGIELADYDFTVGWLKCYVEPLDSVLSVGDVAAAQGIYFECPWMDQERLNGIWESFQGLSFRPASAVRFFGDPRLDPGDIISVMDLNGEIYDVPIMVISHEWDGGIITQISAAGQAKTDEYEGPAQREMKRYASSVAKKAVDNQTHEDIFRKLTNDGAIQGIYVQDGKWYINAELAKIVNLIAENVKSVKGDQTVEIDGGKLEFYIAGALYAVLNSDPIFGGASLGMYSYKDGETAVTTEMHGSGFYAESNEEVFGITNVVQIGIDPETGVPYADLPRLNDMKVYWEPNGDGTFTLKGMEV